MSHRSFSPFEQLPMQPYSYSASVYGPQGYAYDEATSFAPWPGASFSELQAFCNMARESPVSPSICSSFHLDVDTQPQNFNGFNDSNNYYSPNHASNNPNQKYTDEDDGADWFDMEESSLLENGEQMGDDDFPDGKFDFPVPSEPVLPMEELKSQAFGDHLFYISDEGYVQVFTQGECHVPFRGPATIGVWFGSNHPMNVGERLYRGRQTREAAQFAAVIEAIKVAGSCGVKKLQINTDYENIIKFVTYFIFKWENNGWMTVKGTSVKNQALVRELDYWINFLEIKWNYVPYEDSENGNFEAAQLANEALNMQFPGSVSNTENRDGETDAPMVSLNDASSVKKPRHKPIVY